jgi:hypothetical protein
MTLLLLLAGQLLAAPAPRIEVLLNKQMADTAALPRLDANLAVTPSKLILLGSGKGLYVLGWGGLEAWPQFQNLDAFAFTPDGLLLAIRGKDLLHLDAKGELSRFFTLPAAGMGLAPGVRGRMFLFDRGAGPRHALYELSPGRKIRKLLESPKPIQAVTETADGTVLFTSGRAIYAIAKGEKLRAVAGAAEGRPLTSLAVDPAGTIYASDGIAVFSISQGRFQLLTRQAGGALHWLDGGLIVFDRWMPLVIRLTGL